MNTFSKLIYTQSTIIFFSLFCVAGEDNYKSLQGKLTLEASVSPAEIMPYESVKVHTILKNPSDSTVTFTICPANFIGITIKYKEDGTWNSHVPYGYLRDYQLQKK